VFRFVDIVRIVDHQCLNFYFMMLSNILTVKYDGFKFKQPQRCLI